MEAAVVRQFLDLFQDFIRLCQIENWPNENTSVIEIKNAFLVSKHIAKCMDKLQANNIINEFLSAVNNSDDISNNLLKKCLNDPPKYILQKIINSNTKITCMDMGFKIFLELFPEDKLEECLTNLMVEAASKEVLIKQLHNEIPIEKLLEFKSVVLLTEINVCDNAKDILADIFNNIDQNLIQILVCSLINKDICYHRAVKDLACAFVNKMSNKMHTDKEFWRMFLNIDEKYFIKMCLIHADVFELISKALIDCSKLLREDMSTEYFYIDLTYSSLVNIIKKIFKKDCLKLEFFDIVRECNSDLCFWENLTS